MNTSNAIRSESFDQESLLAEMTARDKKIIYLEEQIEWFKRQIFGSADGGEAGAILFSLVQTCRGLGILLNFPVVAIDLLLLNGGRLIYDKSINAKKY
jgi:hypothetical protein